MRFFRFRAIVCGIVITLAIQGQNQPDTRIFSIILSGLSNLISGVYGLLNAVQEPAQVRTGGQLCTQEDSFREHRRSKSRVGLEQLLAVNLESQNLPTIAFCFSGGGMRALVLTLGFLEGAQQTGLLESTTYMAGLSGSTWALARWIASGDALSSCRSSLGKLAVNGLEPIIDPEHIHMLSKSATQWLLVDQPLSTVNIYGALLSNLLFADKGGKRFSLSLKETHQKCILGDYPLPIYTAVAPINRDYQWFEITPFEIGSEYAQAYVPVESYGMKFKAGKSQGKAIPLSLGYFLGIFGSAFHVTLNDLVRITGTKLLHDIANLPSPLDSVVDEVLYKILQGPLHNLRALPSKLRNISYRMPGNPLEHEKWLTLVDAGIACNVPFPVLLRKQRDIDIIIVYDSSAENDSFDTLKCTQDYAISHNMKFPDIDYASMNGDDMVHVFHDKRDSACPVVIYFPMKKNIRYDATFDPIALSRDGYCSTFNFAYNQEQIDKLAGLARYTLIEQIDTIKRTIQEVIAAKNYQPDYV